MRVLVTGANGFIGAQVCRVLLARGHAVVALIHRDRERLAGLWGCADFCAEEGDVLDPERLAALCAAHRIEGVCHLAAQPPTERDRRRQVNVRGTLAVLRAGVRRVVFASSMSVYNFWAPRYLPVDEAHPLEPLQIYGEEKWMAEVYCRLHWGALEVPILRLSGVYGPGKRQGAVYQFARAALRGEAIAIPLNRAVDLLYVQDAAQALISAVEGRMGSGVFNIGAGRAVALAELARRICHRQGTPVPIHCGPAGNVFYLDIGRAQARFGFSPLSLDEALGRFLPWIAAEV